MGVNCLTVVKFVLWSSSLLFIFSLFLDPIVSPYFFSLLWSKEHALLSSSCSTPSLSSTYLWFLISIVFFPYTAITFKIRCQAIGFSWRVRIIGIFLKKRGSNLSNSSIRLRLWNLWHFFFHCLFNFSYLFFSLLAVFPWILYFLLNYHIYIFQLSLLIFFKDKRMVSLFYPPMTLITVHSCLTSWVL